MGICLNCQNILIRNGGEDRLIELTKSYYHDQLGIQMNGFGIYNNDNILNFFCDRTKTENLRGRVVDSNAIPVIIPVVGTDERNNNYHIAMKNALLNHTMRLLIDETTKKQIMEDEGEYASLTSRQKMRALLGHVQTDITVLDEAIKLQQVIKKGFIALVVVGKNKRDRIVATEYANYFFHLKELEMIKKQSSPDWDESDWQLWG